MKEATGNLWDFYALGHWVVVTTNGSLTRRGDAVMGRGVAWQAARRFAYLPALVGHGLQQNGNKPLIFAGCRMITFPVKAQWWEDADLGLIADSTRFLKSFAERSGQHEFACPRPGCGNGRRTWEEVRPLLLCLPDNVTVVSPEAEVCERCGSSSVTPGWCASCGLNRAEERRKSERRSRAEARLPGLD